MGLKIKNTLFTQASLLSLSAALLASPAVAQNVPRSVDPAQVQKRFDAPSNQLPPNRVETPVKPQGPTSKQQQEMAKKRFNLKTVDISGNTVFSDEQLKSTYDSYLGKQISLLDAQHIAEAITAKYRSADYVLSQAVIPSQNVSSGNLKITVVEGYISNVVIQGQGQEDSRRKLVSQYGEELKAKKPVKTADLERYLLLMNDLPGANAKGLVRPGSKPGAAELAVTMNHKKFDGSYTVDNRGTKYVGPWQHTGTFTANSLFGMYDRTLLRVITTSPIEELQFVDLQHEQQIGKEGTKLALIGSYSRTRPGDSLTTTQIDADSQFYQVKLSHPFIRSRLSNLNGRAIFDWRNTDTDVFGNTNFTNDRLRVFRLGGNFDIADKLAGVNLVDAQVSQGVNLFNASRSVDAVSNSNADGTFTKVNLDLSRTQALPRNFSLLTAVSGQYAFDPLLAAEQYALGGVGFGGAYDPAELTGDHGVGAKIELRYGQALNDQYLKAYQIYTYYDIGRTWVREGGAGANDKRSLASVGAGIRTNFSDWLSGSFEVADPLTKDVNNQGDHANEPRFFVSATARF